jgi:hypothetical protein
VVEALLELVVAVERDTTAACALCGAKANDKRTRANATTISLMRCVDRARDMINILKIIVKTLHC